MAATLIPSVPVFVSPEEHRTLVASTPSSFNDIPPVLRHKEDFVSVSLDPPLDGFVEDDGKEGTLYVIDSFLVFMSTTGKGFQIEYPSITLHAVSRGNTSPSIYCQLDESAISTVQSNQNADNHISMNGNLTEEGGDEDEQHEVDLDMRELNIIPRNAESLDPIFEALSFCASLHPDPPTSDDEDDLEAAFADAPDGTFEVFTGSEEQELSEVGRAALAHLESIIYDPFEKRDEEKETLEVEAKNP